MMKKNLYEVACGVGECAVEPNIMHEFEEIIKYPSTIDIPIEVNLKPPEVEELQSINL